MSDRRFKRKLTPFLCQEMLYDYVVGRLDRERKQAVEDYLPTDTDTQRRLAALKIGFIYSEKLSQFALKPSLLTRLNEVESVVEMGHRHWRSSGVTSKVRSRLQLSAGQLKVASVTVSVILLIIAGSLVPWRTLISHRAKANAAEVAAMKKAQGPVSEFGPVDMSESDAQTQAAAEPDGSGDEGDDSSGDFVGKAAPVADVNESAPASAAEASTSMPAALAATQAKAPINVQVPVMNTAASSPSTPADEVDPTSHRSDVAPKGFVYRAFMSLDNVEDVADEITQKIEDQGGEKAGEVELGWKKGEGRYYHFAMPEANEEKLMNALRAYGPVRISKDPHPRVMPKGRVRIILWVDSAK
jgi:hypothetical protein